MATGSRGGRLGRPPTKSIGKAPVRRFEQAEEPATNGNKRESFEPFPVTMSKTIALIAPSEDGDALPPYQAAVMAIVACDLDGTFEFTIGKDTPRESTTEITIKTSEPSINTVKQESPATEWAIDDRARS